MTRAQQYLQSLMENVAEGQIASDAHRLTFAKITRHLSEAEDFDAELRRLYKVTGFDTFALSLMWIAGEVEKNPAKTECAPDEQSMVVSNFRYAIGDLEPPPAGQETFPTPETGPSEEVFAGLSPAEEETPAVAEVVEPPASVPEPSTFAAAPVAGGEAEFAALMERFVEAMQSGSDDRDALVQSVLAQCSAFTAEGSGTAEDLKEFGTFLSEFLQYIMENGFMDDVRVMNILSNVSSPVSSWAQTPPDGREGILAEGTEILRTFKSLFE